MASTLDLIGDEEKKAGEDVDGRSEDTGKDKRTQVSQEIATENKVFSSLTLHS
jgi:hypothetical protein